MPTVTMAEHVEIGGLALATPAWQITDLSGLYASGAVRGDGHVIPFHDGRQSYRTRVDAKSVLLPIQVFGHADPDGVAYADRRVGLAANLDQLKRVLRPVGQPGAGTRTLRHHLPDGTSIRSAGCQVNELTLGPAGPYSYTGVLDLTIPGGLLRDETVTTVTSASIAAGATGTLNVPNAGTADQYETVITLTGTATVTRIRSTTWDPTGGTWLEFGGTPNAGVVIDTGLWTAVRGGVSVIGLVSHSGHERWLPLSAGATNVLEILPTGGTATVKVDHYPAYL